MTPFPHSRAGTSPALPPVDPLTPLGWTPGRTEAFRARFPAACVPGRVVATSRGLALAQAASFEGWCAPTGRLRERLLSAALSLSVGDWIALQTPPGASKAQIIDVLPRGPSLLRQASGPGGRPQCLAANLDLVLLVMGLDRNFNPARMERLLALAWGSGAQPLVVLTKRDLNAGAEAFVSRIEGLAPGVQVLAVSALRGEGLEEIKAHLSSGLTGVMVGSSGAGKSTLLNALVGQVIQRTQEVRSVDGRGRHTTSMRELFLLPGGGCLIDTPGLREVGLCADGCDLETTFSEIAALGMHCRFRDCTHGAEPGCAVQGALAEGHLAPDRYRHYLWLRREMAFEAARSDEQLWRAREAKWRRIGKLQKHFKER